MSLIEAFKYMKKIINNGIKKGYSVSAVKNSIDTYVDILVEEGNITSKDARTLKGIKEDLSSIMSKKVTADEAFIEILGERDKPKEKVKKVHEVESPVIVSCGGSSVKRDRCGNVITDRCGSPVFESPSSRCGGSSSSSSCGSGWSTSRC